MDPKDFEYLFESTRKISDAKRLRHERDERIASILRYKRGTVQEIMNATGLTKARIYQIANAAGALK